MIFSLIFVNFILINSFEHDNSEIEKKYSHSNDVNNIRILNISYELTSLNPPILKVKIKIDNKLISNISFKAFLKTEDNKKEFILDCLIELKMLIICSTNTDALFDKTSKYYFYYNIKKSGNNLTFDGKELFEDSRRVSLIFNPEVPSHQILFNDSKKFYVLNRDDILSGGYLFITRKSKKILKNPENGFNKFIGLNNFIPRAGLGIYRPQGTFIAYKEAIRRGYKMVDADILFTKDKIPVVAHDILLQKNSNGEGSLVDKTIEELEKFDFGIRYSKKYSGQKILKLDDLLKLCKQNNIILDLDLHHLNYPQFLKKKHDFLKILIKYIEKNDMINSVVFNDNRQKIFDIMKSIRKDISFSISGMNEKENIKKIKDKYKESKILIYNMGLLQAGKTINEDAVKYGKSLGKKIKAAKIDDINFANKVTSWGVNFICTNKLHSFLMKNVKEEPIQVKCISSQDNYRISICKLDENINLIDNEVYNIYYSSNIYNITNHIVEIPIGEFKYVNTNLFNQLYYKLTYFDFKKGIIMLTTSNSIRLNKKIIGYIGPAYDSVAKCYQYKYICNGNGSNKLFCNIKKNDPNKVNFKGKYNIYNLEGYSFNPIEVNKKLNNFIKIKTIKILIIYIIIIFIICVIILSKNLKNKYKLISNLIK